MDQLEQVREIAERVATSEGLELVEVEFHGRGSNAVLRVYIDKPGGVTIDDCQNVSRQMSVILDVEDPIPASYTLEVSSPGLDRKLSKPSDFERFAGSQVKFVLRSPLLLGAPAEGDQAPRGQRRFQARLLGIDGGAVQADTGGGNVVQFDLTEIEKANLIVEFGAKPKPQKRR